MHWCNSPPPALPSGPGVRRGNIRPAAELSLAHLTDRSVRILAPSHGKSILKTEQFAAGRREPRMTTRDRGDRCGCRCRLLGCRDARCLGQWVRQNAPYRGRRPDADIPVAMVMLPRGTPMVASTNPSRRRTKSVWQGERVPIGSHGSHSGSIRKRICSHASIQASWLSSGLHGGGTMPECTIETSKWAILAHNDKRGIAWRTTQESFIMRTK